MRMIQSIAVATIVVTSPHAVAGVEQISWDFEQGRGASTDNGVAGWFFTGGAGLDNGKGLEHKGKGNAWVRNRQGWNAVNNWVSMSTARAGTPCSATAWLRTSDTLTDGYMSVRDGDKADGSGRILSEIKLDGANPPGAPQDHGYAMKSFEFTWGASSKVLFYVGLWGNSKDAWIQIDDANIACEVPYPK